MPTKVTLLIFVRGIHWNIASGIPTFWNKFKVCLLNARTCRHKNLRLTSAQFDLVMQPIIWWYLCNYTLLLNICQILTGSKLIRILTLFLVADLVFFRAKRRRGWDLRFEKNFGHIHFLTSPQALKRPSSGIFFPASNFLKKKTGEIRRFFCIRFPLCKYSKGASRKFLRPSPSFENGYLKMKQKGDSLVRQGPKTWEEVSAPPLRG